jgi:hypothetical protein
MTTKDGPQVASDEERDRRITAERDETKYLIARSDVARVVAIVGGELRPHRFEGDGANRLPAPQHFVTTVYFDTPSRAHYRGLPMSEGPGAVRVRAKEYYDVHPGLIETANKLDGIVRYQPWIWFELKRRSGVHTTKHRFRLRKRDIPLVLGDGSFETSGLSEIDKGAFPAEVGQIVSHCDALSEPLISDCLVNYRRLAWQDANGELRVTLDLDLGVFDAPSALWKRQKALVRASLGLPRLILTDGVLEVKGNGRQPRWIGELLREVDATPIPFSKFTLASASVRCERRTLASR